MAVDKWVRGLIAMGIVGVACYLAIVGEEVPGWLLGLVGLSGGQYVPKPGTLGGGK